ncbi:D-alanyl-D-alanine carboxypeptidase [Candidatus Nomurabacteria bacterium]|nr:D-alanyl-D-alanine carboxypeptidase [Candidatus Nomurabacteria bacterium]
MKVKHFFISLFLVGTSFFAIGVPVFAAAATPKELETAFLSLAAAQGLSSYNQSICIAEPSGRTISYNADTRTAPASVTKLYVFDMALHTLPENFRYQTTFIQKGSTLYFNGAGDAHFTIEHLRIVIQDVYKETGVKINTIVISPDAYFNWQSTPASVQSAMTRALKAEKGLPLSTSVVVRIAPAPYNGPGTKYIFYSAPLISLLKQINNFSTNIAAEALFQKMGGKEAMALYLKNTYGVGEETASFTTGSGLSGNYTTCNLTLRIIKHIDDTLRMRGYDATSILSVPTVDPGVLQPRAIDERDAHALTAKSGFINYHHTFAGIVNTKNGSVYFGIFTTYPALAKGPATKSMIDLFVNRILAYYHNLLVPFAYIPSASAVPEGYLVEKTVS